MQRQGQRGSEAQRMARAQHVHRGNCSEWNMLRSLDIFPDLFEKLLKNIEH